MHKYFKELDTNGNIIGQCSITYKDKNYLNKYIQNCFKTIEISEKEYIQIRKQLSKTKEDIINV
jgi:5-bromo-4-chloroindolyl phosphate hydrolysis protein